MPAGGEFRRRSERAVATMSSGIPAAVVANAPDECALESVVEVEASENVQSPFLLAPDERPGIALASLLRWDFCFSCVSLLLFRAPLRLVHAWPSFVL